MDLHQRLRHFFMMQRADFLECMRERIVTDIVKQRGDAHVGAWSIAKIREVAAFLEEQQRAPSEMIGAERVLETRMARARVHKERESKLSYIAQSLERRCVDESQRQRFNADVVPERVADDFHV